MLAKSNEHQSSLVMVVLRLVLMRGSGFGSRDIDPGERWKRLANRILLSLHRRMIMRRRNQGVPLGTLARNLVFLGVW
jgi:hypothetical protein